MRHELDLAVVGEFRFPGGSARRLARTLEILAADGLEIGLLPVRSDLVRTGTGWNPALTDLAERPNVQMIGPDDELHAPVALLQHPSVFADLQVLPVLRLTLSRAVIVASQPPVSDQGDVRYHPAQVHHHLAALLRAPVSWAPTDLVTRVELAQWGVPTQAIRRQDWPGLPPAPPSGGPGAPGTHRATAALFRRQLGLRRRSPTPGIATDTLVAPQTSATSGSSRRPRVMFITSNGAGMGHLTRELGIARALGSDVDSLFMSMSQGVPVVAAFGFPYEYIPFNSALRVDTRRWNTYFAARLTRALTTFDPDAVVFDGVWPYQGLLTALESGRAHRVWVRRGMWKPHISPAQLEKAGQFDLVIEPGDYAATYDRGATTQVSGALRVGPITILDQSELLDRDQARKELGLDLQAQIALITLGAGNINDVSDVQAAFIDEVEQLGSGWRAVVTRAPIAESSSPDRTKTVSVFPLARYSRAFDFAVSATGYNSYHEWVSAALPTVWVPNTHTITDDQNARGHFAADHHLGLNLIEPDRAAIRAAVRRMADGRTRSDFVQYLRAVRARNGAHEAADHLRTLLGRTP